MSENRFYFSKKVRLFSQNDVLFLFYFLINPTMTTAKVSTFKNKFCKAKLSVHYLYYMTGHQCKDEVILSISLQNLFRTEGVLKFFVQITGT